MDDTPTNEKKKRWGSATWAIGGVAAVALVGSAYAFGSGTTDESWGEKGRAVERSEPSQLPEQRAPAPAVQAAEATRDVRGVVKAVNEATLASRMTARIVDMPLKVGARFGRGAALARFDCSQLRAQLNAAQAASTAYQKTYETNVELDQFKAIGTNEVAVSKANLGKAEAEATAIHAQLGDCQVVAPFGGTVVEKIANTGEVAASGQPLIKIQSGGAMEAELIVPSNWLTWLAPGARFAFVVDETGERIGGTIKRLGASVDPVSKTIRVTGDLTPGDRIVLPGMSGTAQFDKPGNRADRAGPAAARS